MSDVTKLPKWAQAEIQKLTADVEWWKKKATAGERESNTFIDHFTRADEQGLGIDPRIKFVLGDDPGRWDQEIQVRVQEGRLVVQGGRGLIVQPSSSNVLYISVEER